MKRKMDNIPVSDVSDELQCPVCLLIPREVPIPACPVGHIVCKKCRVNVTICPTCRRPMHQEGTNAIVNRMIERVPHSCKYSQCQVKNYLKEIKEHEIRCPERTVKCPYLRCDDEVQVSEYQKHAMAKKNTCNIFPNYVSKTITRTSFNQKTAISQTSIWDWPMRAFKDHGKIFYLHQHFFASKQTWAWYVTLAENSNEADKYLAKMTLKNLNDDRKSLSIAQNVISIDSAPNDNKSVLDSKSVMLVHMSTISGFFKWRNVTEEGIQHTLSTVEATIDILFNNDDPVIL